MRALLAVLLIALSAAAQAELSKGDEWRASTVPQSQFPVGDIIMRWGGIVSYGVKVFDSAGNEKPDVLSEYPVPPPPPLSKFPRDGHWRPRQVPMRSGAFLMVGTRTPNPIVMKYDPATDEATYYELPPEPYVTAYEIELFADQCTLAWTIESFFSEQISPARKQVIRRFNICANKPAGDLVLVPAPAHIPRFVRQLINGDLLVVTRKDYEIPSEILRYGPSGNFIASYSNPLQTPITELRLTPDGRGFWVADETRLVRYDLANTREPVVNVEAIRAKNSSESVWVTEFTVVGEWRAALQPPPVIPKRRSVPH
jgi:hypothetical protein